jgi:hypothetical protein
LATDPDLKALVDSVSGFASWTHAEKIKFFAWFLHTYRKKERVTGTDVGACYAVLHDEPPSSISPFLGNMEKKNPKEAMRDGDGYYLVKKVRDQFDAKYGQRDSTVKVEKLLADLPGKIPDAAERDFLSEALSCFRNKAFRAAIVMTWNLTYFHLCHYVLKHRLADFNAEYPKRHPGIHKKAKAPTIASYDDFASDLKESDVVEICRSANIITKEQFNALDRQIARRNSAAHPSTTAITYLQAEEFIHDLVTNVVLTITI